MIEIIYYYQNLTCLNTDKNFYYYIIKSDQTVYVI